VYTHTHLFVEASKLLLVLDVKLLQLSFAAAQIPSHTMYQTKARHKGVSQVPLCALPGLAFELVVRRSKLADLFLPSG
jgi:hypothetical protein